MSVFDSGIGAPSTTKELCQIVSCLQGRCANGEWLDDVTLSFGIWALNLAQRGMLLLDPYMTHSLLQHGRVRALLTPLMFLPTPHYQPVSRKHPEQCFARQRFDAPPQRIRLIGLPLFNNNHWSLMYFIVREWLAPAEHEVAELNAFFVDSLGADSCHRELREQTIRKLFNNGFSEFARDPNDGHTKRTIRLVPMPCAMQSRELCGLYVLAAAALLADKQKLTVLNDKIVLHIRDAYLLPMAHALHAWHSILLDGDSVNNAATSAGTIPPPLLPNDTISVRQLYDATSNTDVIDSRNIIQVISALFAGNLTLLFDMNLLDELNSNCRLCALLLPIVQNTKDRYGSQHVSDVDMVVIGRVGDTLMGHYYHRLTKVDKQPVFCALKQQFKKLRVANNIVLLAHHSLEALGENGFLFFIDYLATNHSRLCGDSSAQPAVLAHNEFYKNWCRRLGPSDAFVNPINGSTKKIRRSILRTLLSRIRTTLWYTACAHELTFHAQLGGNNKFLISTVAIVPNEQQEKQQRRQQNMTVQHIRGCDLIMLPRAGETRLINPRKNTHPAILASQIASLVLATPPLFMSATNTHFIEIDTEHWPEQLNSVSILAYTERVRSFARLTQHEHDERCKLTAYVPPVVSLASNTTRMQRIVQVWVHALEHNIPDTLRAVIKDFIQLTPLEHIATPASRLFAKLMFCTWPIMWSVDGMINSSINQDSREFVPKYTINLFIALFQKARQDGNNGADMFNDFPINRPRAIVFPVHVEVCSCCSSANTWFHQNAHDRAQANHTLVVSIDVAFRMAKFDEFKKHQLDPCSATIGCAVGRWHLFDDTITKFELYSSFAVRSTHPTIALGQFSDAIAPQARGNIFPEALQEQQQAMGVPLTRELMDIDPMNNTQHLFDAILGPRAPITVFSDHEQFAQSLLHVPNGLRVCNDHTHIPLLVVSQAAFTNVLENNVKAFVSEAASKTRY